MSMITDFVSKFIPDEQRDSSIVNSIGYFMGYPQMSFDPNYLDRYFEIITNKNPAIGVACFEYLYYPSLFYIKARFGSDPSRDLEVYVTDASRGPYYETNEEACVNVIYMLSTGISNKIVTSIKQMYPVSKGYSSSYLIKL